MRVPRKGMILAAGFGTRLRPLTDAVPKALLEIGGRAMIEYPLRMLAAAGVEDVVVNLHHLGDAIREALGDGRRHGVRIHYCPEDPLLDTGGALAHARRLLGSEAFVLANCDALLDPDLAAVWDFHRARHAIATLVLRADPRAESYGAVDCDGAGRVRRFLGKPAEVDAPLERRMFCGVHVLSPEIFSHMPSTPVFSITRDVYSVLVARGEAIYGYDYRGYWRDLGTVPSLERARAEVTSKRFDPMYLRSY
jgi:NDP-sugar pyrophosphorylase family protein